MLYIVPTPLGNLQDITLRALETIKNVQIIYCEETWRTRKLLSHYGIHKPVARYNDHDPRSVRALTERLKSGENLALVCAGGMPTVSDPGLKAVQAARREKIPVAVLPGPSAVTAAVAGSGLPGDSFVFLGFLPRSSSKRKRALSEAASLGKTIVVYESPHRLAQFLEDAEEALGPEAQTSVAREMTKVFEEWICGTLEEVRSAVLAKKEILGEIVVVLHPARK